VFFNTNHHSNRWTGHSCFNNSNSPPHYNNLNKTPGGFPCSVWEVSMWASLLGGITSSGGGGGGQQLPVGQGQQGETTMPMQGNGMFTLNMDNESSPTGITNDKQSVDWLQLLAGVGGG